MQQWQADFFKKSPIFNDLNRLLGHKGWLSWPSCEELNKLLPNDLANYQGQPLTLVEQNDELLSDGIYYEQRIFEQGLVPTRPANWHDFFNALIFLLFPQTKKEMNRLHVEHMAQYGSHKRTPCRDAITLFDECGVIIAYTDDDIMEHLSNHEWREGFVDKRSFWDKKVSATIIGHANYEKSLDPYIGFTGKALYLKVQPEFFALNFWDKYQYLDTLLAKNLGELLKDNRRLYPLPMLGVPGWWPANEDKTFYDNKHYFRAKRKTTVS